MTRTDDVDAGVLAQIHQLYGWQSHLIDGGSAREWAETFTPDGEFNSPSYPEAVIGTADLQSFAERFYANAAAANEVHRHVVTNLVVDVLGEDTLRVQAYLQIVATTRGGESRLVRFTTLDDTVVRAESGWKIARRNVFRDDS